MTILPIILIVAAINAAPAGPNASAKAGLPDTSPAPVAPIAPIAPGIAPLPAVPAAPAAAVPAVGSDDALQAEIQRLIQLQDEIKALLAASATAPLRPAPEPAATNTGAGQAGLSPRAVADVEPLDALAAADAFYRAGRYSDAFSLYERAASTDKEDKCWILFQKANSLRKIGRSTDALALYQKIITEYPDTFWAAEAEWWHGETQWKQNFKLD